MNPLVQTWLLQSAVIFLIIGSFAGILTGALLVLRPQILRRLSAPLNRWVSTRHLDKALDRGYSIDNWLYRYRTYTGGAILIGAFFVLYFFTVNMEREQAIAGLARHFHYPILLVSGLLDALVLSALVGALCAVFVALFMLFRPSLLREFEQGANQWLSLRKALKPMEIPRENVDSFAYQHARQLGVFLMLGGLYALVFLIIWLMRSS